MLDKDQLSGYWSPRTDAQRILTRHSLLRELFGADFEDLMQEELEFSVEATRVVGGRAAELGVKLSRHLDPVDRAAVEEAYKTISHWEGTYEHLWSESLKGRSATPLKVLELTCGIGRDYECLESYGIARFIDYTGVDPNRASVNAASERFPGVRFDVEDIFALPYRDRSFDYVVASDIFEYLSPPDVDRLLGEASRLARRGLIINFFSMVDKPKHSAIKRGANDWRALSAQMVSEILRTHFDETSMNHIRSHLEEKVGYRRWYNPNAWTAIAEHRHSADR